MNKFCENDTSEYQSLSITGQYNKISVKKTCKEDVYVIKSVIALVVAFALCVVIDHLKKKSTSFVTRILLVTAMGATVGLTFKGAADYVAIFGRVFINLSQAFIIPLLLFSVITTVASLENTEKLRSTGRKTVGILTLHNVLASVAALILGKSVNLGVNANIKMGVTDKVKEVPLFSDVFANFFPKNIVDSVLHTKVVPAVVFTVIIGVTTLKYSSKDEIKPFMDFTAAADKVMNKIIREIIEFTPCTVLSLLARQVATLDLSFVASSLFLLLMVYVCYFSHTFIATAVMLKLMAHINPFEFQRKFFPAWLLGFTTQNSLGTLPENIREQEKVGVPTETASFAASIGTTLGMPGCAAVWNILLSVFTINALNISFTMAQYVIMVFTALLASTGTVGVPEAGTMLDVALFTAMGLSPGMILALGSTQGVTDMTRASTNVHAGGSTDVIIAAM